MQGDLIPDYSPNSATIAEILTSAKAALVTGTGLDASKVFIALNPNPIKDCYETHLSIRLEPWNPDSYGGAGRRSTRVKRNLLVTVFQRMNLDQIRRDDLWYAQEATGLYALEDATIDTLHVNYLFSPQPEARKLLALPLHWMPGHQAAMKPDPNPDWGFSVLSFEMDYIQRLVLNASLGE